MRCRPAFLHDFLDKTPGTPEHHGVRGLIRPMGTKGDHQLFTRPTAPAGFLALVQDTGLTRTVVVGRHTRNQHLPIDTINQIVSADPEFVDIGSVCSWCGAPRPFCW